MFEIPITYYVFVDIQSIYGYAGAETGIVYVYCRLSAILRIGR